jgi:hypothetical protein
MLPGMQPMQPMVPPGQTPYMQQTMPYGYLYPTNNIASSPYNLDRIETKMDELKEQVQSLNKRVNQLEGYLGIKNTKY